MAKRRTRKEKIIARLRHQLKASIHTKPVTDKLKRMPLQVSAGKKDNQSNKTDKLKQSIAGEDIFGYDPTLINRDLRKTALLSVIFTIIIVAFWFWQKNSWWMPNF